MSIKLFFLNKHEPLIKELKLPLLLFILFWIKSFKYLIKFFFYVKFIFTSNYFPFFFKVLHKKLLKNITFNDDLSVKQALIIYSKQITFMYLFLSLQKMHPFYFQLHYSFTGFKFLDNHRVWVVIKKRIFQF